MVIVIGYGGRSLWTYVYVVPETYVENRLDSEKFVVQYCVLK